MAKRHARPDPPGTSIFAPSADFKATTLNKVIFPIKIAKPLIPLSQQLFNQGIRSIVEEQKEKPRKGCHARGDQGKFEG
ncbi:MAG: hypothetical protein WB869_14370 [Candidatus Acidiferrales bacterium]